MKQDIYVTHKIQVVYCIPPIYPMFSIWATSSTTMNVVSVRDSWIALSLAMCIATSSLEFDFHQTPIGSCFCFEISNASKTRDQRGQWVTLVCCPVPVFVDFHVRVPIQIRIEVLLKNFPPSGKTCWINPIEFVRRSAGSARSVLPEFWKHENGCLGTQWFRSFVRRRSSLFGCHDPSGRCDEIRVGTDRISEAADLAHGKTSGINLVLVDLQSSPCSVCLSRSRLPSFSVLQNVSKSHLSIFCSGLRKDTIYCICYETMRKTLSLIENHWKNSFQDHQRRKHCKIRFPFFFPCNSVIGFTFNLMHVPNARNVFGQRWRLLAQKQNLLVNAGWLIAGEFFWVRQRTHTSQYYDGLGLELRYKIPTGSNRNANLHLKLFGSNESISQEGRLLVVVRLQILTRRATRKHTTGTNRSFRLHFFY